MKDEEKDLYIKRMLKKDDYIPKDINNLLNNPLNNIEKKKVVKMEEKNNKIGKFKILKRSLATAACLVIVLVGGNVYAVNNGYENVFFMIKYMVTGDSSSVISDRDKILEDRDITMSYEPIRLTENIELIISKLQIKDNQAKLLIQVNETEKNAEVISYKVYASNGEELCNQLSSKTDENVSEYVDEIILDGIDNNENKLKLEVYNSNQELIATLEIDLDNKTITVVGEEEALEKISEIELKEYLGLLSGGVEATSGDTTINIDMAIGSILKLLTDTNMATGEYGNSTYKAEEVYDALESIYGTEVRKEAESVSKGDLFGKVTIDGTEYIEFEQAGDTVFEGTCINITDISYCAGIYSVTYTYTFLGTESLFDVDINNYEIFQNTVGIKLNEDTTYSKFQMVSLDYPETVQASSAQEENDDTNITDNANWDSEIIDEE